MKSAVGLQVALVGRVLPDNENLGIAYLEAALSGAGIRRRSFVLNRWGDIGRICSQIMDGGVDVVGMSLADGGSSAPVLALGELLERRGFGGHITAGGQFATLARCWLLDRYSWLDSVVRHAGEVPIVGLVRSLERGEDGSNVPGVTTRAGDGMPAPVLDSTPLQIWPEHDALPMVLSHPMAHISTSRGCKGRCGFCGPAALQDLEIEEGLRAGSERRKLVSCGVGGVKRRSIESICDEMAHLWHDRGVRYFYLVDEHPLPWKENDALDFIARWKQGLARRKVGRLGLGAMLRSDRITTTLARALNDLGFVRAFLGIELVTEEETRHFGRACMAAKARNVIELLERLGTATITNIMLIHPYSTPETIRSGLDFLDDLPAGAFEVTQMQVYHGTRLHRVMQAERRLRGNPLRYSYDHLDPVVERYARAFSRLRAEVFADYSLAYRTFDLRYAIALERRLGGRKVHPGSWRRACALAGRINASRLRALREALERAVDGSDFDDVVARARRDARALNEEILGLTSRVESSGTAARRLMTPMRAAASTALRFCLLGSLSAACGATETLVSSDAGHEEVIADPADDGACTDGDYLELLLEILRIVGEVDPCFVGSVSWNPETEEWMATLGDDFDGYQLCSDWEEQTAREERLERALAGVDRTCLPPWGPVFPVHGSEGEDHERMTDARWDAGCDYWADVVIVVGEDGRVVDARPWEGRPVDPEVLECIVSALEGLTFPCLAGYEICPEYIVLE